METQPENEIASDDCWDHVIMQIINKTKSIPQGTTNAV